MAVEVEAAGQVDEFLRVLKRRIWWIVIPFVLIGSLGTFFAVVVPKKYVVYSEIMVRDRSGPGDPGAQPASDMEGQVATYSIRAPERIRSVLINRKWPPGFKDLSRAEQQEFIDELLQDLSVRLEPMPRDVGKQLVKISYKYTDATDAYNFVKALIDNWTDEVVQGALQTTDRQLSETVSQLDEVREKLLQNAEERTEIRGDHQIATVTSGPGGKGQRPEHEVFASLRRVDIDIDELEDEIVDLGGNVDLVQAQLDRMPARIPRDIETLTDPDEAELDALDREIEAIQRQIENRGLSTATPDRQRAERKIMALKKRQREIVNSRSRTLDDPSAQIDNPLYLERTEQLANMRTTLGQLEGRLKRQNDRKADLEQEREAINEAISRLDVLVARNDALEQTQATLVAKKTELEGFVAFLGSEEGIPWEERRAPTIPLKPTSPNPWFISIGSILMGLGIGLGLALLKEYSKSCFRSPRELTRVMTHPVLGKINRIRTRRERARSVLVRAVLGGGTLLFAVGVGWITWAWAADSPALTDSLRTAIDDFRELLM